MSNIRLDQYGRVDTRGMTKEEYVDLLRKRKDKNNRVTVYRTERSVTRYILDYDNILHFEAMIRDTYDDYKFTFDDWKKKGFASRDDYVIHYINKMHGVFPAEYMNNYDYHQYFYNNREEAYKDMQNELPGKDPVSYYDKDENFIGDKICAKENTEDD